jgi:pimeloyl-ACP methyl ester carboxylesterase
VGAPLGRLAPRRRVLVAGVVLLVALIAATVAVRACTSGPVGRPGLPDQSRPGPVLLVPGYGGGQGALAVLADRLRATGRSATIVTLPGDGTGDLAEQAATLDAAVTRALRAGAPSVDVVGYSAGGVVALLWLVRHDGVHAARRMVTLGAPLHGTRSAAAASVAAPGACPTACHQLAPGSALLTELAGVTVPDRLPWLSVWTDNDQTVVPPDSARLPGALNVPVQSVCPGAHVEHGGLPIDALVQGLVLGALATAPPTLPGPADCARLRN